MVFHGPISIKKKSGIGRKQKNGSSFHRHENAIADTEVVDQHPDETTSSETTQPPHKCLFSIIVKLKTKLSYGKYMLLLVPDDLSSKCLCIQNSLVS